MSTDYISATPAITSKTLKDNLWMICVGFLFVVAIFLLNPITARDLQLALAGRNDTFTQLSFDNSTSLPQTTTGKPLSFAFHVTNNSAQPITYSFEITAQATGGLAKNVKSGQLILAAGEGTSMQESLALAAITQRTEISVVLPMQNLSIHFWVTPAPASTKVVK